MLYFCVEGGMLMFVFYLCAVCEQACGLCDRNAAARSGAQ